MIVEARIMFDSKQEIKRITVLSEVSPGDERIITASNTVRSGYTYIRPGAVLSEELIQEVADYGQQVLIWPKS